MDKATVSRVFSLVLLAAGGWICLVIIGIMMIHFSGLEEGADSLLARFGQMGDSFGAINCLFSSAAVIAAVATLAAQQHQFKEQLKEQRNNLATQLRLQRMQFSEQVKEQRNNLATQLRLQRMQFREQLKEQRVNFANEMDTNKEIVRIQNRHQECATKAQKLEELLQSILAHTELMAVPVQNDYDTWCKVYHAKRLNTMLRAMALSSLYFPSLMEKLDAWVDTEVKLADPARNILDKGRNKENVQNLINNFAPLKDACRDFANYLTQNAKSIIEDNSAYREEV